MSQWHLFVAAARCEEKACESLTQMGVSTFVPMETVERKLNREIEPYDRPLFPGYVFALVSEGQFADAKRANYIRAAVMRHLPSGDRAPRVVPPGLVEALRAAQADGRFDRTKREPERPLEAGDMVRITDGSAFDGLVGTILELRGEARVALLLKSTTVELDRGCVELAA